MSYNALSGSLPVEFSSLQMSWFDVTSNQLEGSVTDSLPRSVLCVARAVCVTATPLLDLPPPSP